MGAAIEKALFSCEEPFGRRPAALTKKQSAILGQKIRSRPEYYLIEQTSNRPEDFYWSYLFGKSRNFRDGRWTGPLLAVLIETEFGLMITPRTANKLLKKLHGRV